MGHLAKILDATKMGSRRSNTLMLKMTSRPRKKKTNGRQDRSQLAKKAVKLNA